MYALENSTILLSSETISELEETLLRSKFKKYFSHEDATKFLSSLQFIAELIYVNEKLNISRDSDDNKILELAISGKADLIITGDDDLLVLREFRGVGILSPN